MTDQQLLSEFRKMMSLYATSNRSDNIRLALCELICCAYSSGLIDREEYHSSIAYIR